uniref:hypothetical protein n=1 Tax=Agathobacter sp. TaxID=2021311 RepID=UPI004056AECF
MNQYKVYDEMDAIYEIRKKMSETYPQTYLLTGILEEDAFVIKSYQIFLENTQLFAKQDASGGYLKEKADFGDRMDYLLRISKGGNVSFLLNTHPTEFQRQLAENETDWAAFKPIYGKWHDVYEKIPIFFGIMGKENVSIRMYVENSVYEAVYQSRYEIDGNPDYEVEFLEGTYENMGILYFINTKKEVLLPLTKIHALKKWKKQREKKQLPQLHDTAYKNLIVGYYNGEHNMF